MKNYTIENLFQICWLIFGTYIYHAWGGKSILEFLQQDPNEFLSYMGKGLTYFLSSNYNDKLYDSDKLIVEYIKNKNNYLQINKVKIDDHNIFVYFEKECDISNIDFLTILKFIFYNHSSLETTVIQDKIIKYIVCLTVQQKKSTKILK